VSSRWVFGQEAFLCSSWWHVCGCVPPGQSWWFSGSLHAHPARECDQWISGASQFHLMELLPHKNYGLLCSCMRRAAYAPVCHGPHSNLKADGVDFPLLASGLWGSHCHLPSHELLLEAWATDVGLTECWAFLLQLRAC
jgi:hypothetical protein